MRCPACQYRLWNLSSRQCPECGRAFRPGEFRFTPGHVQFCCPQCGQSYYGTAENGHLQPPEFDCVTCGLHLHMDDTILIPAAGLDEELTDNRLPWLERSERGFWRGWGKTTVRAFVDPGRVIAALPEGAPLVDAVWYALVSSFFFMSLGVAPFLILPLLAGLAGAAGGATMLVAFPVSCLVMLLGTLLWLGLWGLAAHAVLRLTGGTARGLSMTYQALSYASGANALTAVPCFGMYVGWMWWVISAVLMVRRVQGVHAARAALAVAAPPLLGLATLVGLYIFALTQMPVFVSMTAGQAAPELQIVADVLRNYGRDHDGHGPRHALELTQADKLDPFDLLSASTLTLPEGVPLGDSTLAAYFDHGEAQRRATRQACAQAQPEDVIAHRVGDIVFTYHGIDLEDAEANLWIALLWPDPAANGIVDPNGIVAAATVDGRVREFQALRITAELAAQNTLRASYDLPALAAPQDITHERPQDRPATAAGSGDSESAEPSP